MVKRDRLDLLIATLAYADIFDFPLTRTEIHRWFIQQAISKQDVQSLLKKYPGRYVFFRNRGEIVKKRQIRLTASIVKWRIARSVASVLSSIPSVLCVGVSGSLSMNNADKEDDIDLYIVAAEHTVWMSRLLCVFLTSLVANRRRPTDTQVQNAVCLNMFTAPSQFALPTKEQNLYSAHEILQLVPLFDRGGMYQQLLEANIWMKKYIPNAWEEKSRQFSIHNFQVSNKSSNFLLEIGNWILKTVDPLAQLIQLWYMQRRRTTEVVEEEKMKFHPHDAQIWVRLAFEKRLHQLGIPLDKIFQK